MPVSRRSKSPVGLTVSLGLLLVAPVIGDAASGDGSCATDGSEPRLYFPGIGRISYEGPSSKNPLAFRYYNPDEVIVGKPMREWLRFSVAYWHTMRNDGGDMFGSPTRVWPWEDAQQDAMVVAKTRMSAFFEFLDKLGVDYWCFHDRDIAPEGSSLAESNRLLDEVADHALQLQRATGKRVLWGTAQLFKHPRYMHGAATSPNATVFAYAAAQVKKAMEVSKKLGATAYVFWGGREGYHTLRNTNLRLELNNLARFLRMAAEYRKKIEFDAQLLLEPKPQEPTKHQYDFDAATTMNFLHTYGLAQDYKLNIECNHATLAGHSCEHELAMSSAYGMLGNIDANTGDPQTGWDTDQFMTDVTEATLTMAVVLKQGGLAPGGINFDAKLRRESFDLEDLFIAHISGMDALARGLRNAAHMMEDGIVDGMLKSRYSSYEDGIGAKIVQQQVTFEDLERFALSHHDPVDDIKSGKAELHDFYLSTYVE